ADFPACNLRLDGNNYLLWSQLVRTAIQTGESVGFLTGNEQKPISSSTSNWVAKDARVMTYLISHKNPRLLKIYAFLNNSAEIWKAMKTKYSRKGNYLQIFQLRKRIQKLEQGSMVVDTYFAELSTLWQELDVYEDIYEC
ncbi:UBN2_3 domain-containing protein, partial [Cephalotus follicularis]